MNLSLGADGSATVTEDSGNGATTLFGHWVDTGGQVAVTFDASAGGRLSRQWFSNQPTMGCKRSPGITPRGEK